MKKTTLLFSLFLLPSILFSICAQEISILSLNNSLIDYNNQPEIFEKLAASTDKKASWIKQTKGGKTLRFHYEEGEDFNSEGQPTAKKMVRSKAWDYIILQEQSRQPVVDFEDFRESVGLWKEYIKENCPNPDAKIILTMNWAYVDSNTFEEDTEKLSDNYKSVGKEFGITVCPVGYAYEIIRKEDGEQAKNALYTDNRHPSVSATYLSACMIYAVIYNQSPVDTSYHPDSMSSTEAVLIQKRGWETYNRYLKSLESADCITSSDVN